MDEDVLGAIRACPVSGAAEVENWFRLLCSIHREQEAAGRLDWAEFETALRSQAETVGAPESGVDVFVEFLTNTPDPMDVLRQLDQLADQLPQLYAQAQQGEDTPAAADVGTWDEYLATNGPYWDGAESSWQAFREWFAYNAQAAGVGDEGEGFLGYVEAAADKVAAFAEYGITIGAPAAAPAAEVPAEATTASDDIVREDRCAGVGTRPGRQPGTRPAVGRAAHRADEQGTHRQPSGDRHRRLSTKRRT